MITDTTNTKQQNQSTLAHVLFSLAAFSHALGRKQPPKL